MSNKNNKKFVPKSGNPAKRAKELEDYKFTQERLIEKRRADKAYTERMDSANYKPQNVGGIYTPPDFITRIEQLEAPKPKVNKKADKRKIWGGVVGFVALGAMVFSGLAGLESAFSPAQQQQQQTNVNNQQSQLLDEKGNPILVDVYGNPLDGSVVPQGTTNNNSQISESQVIEIPAEGENPPSGEENTEKE